MRAIHVDMLQALTAAAVEVGVRRFVLISAISAHNGAATDYAALKLASEQALRRSPVGRTILRPSLAYGDDSYGGTSLLRGLAGLPLVVPLPGSGDFPFTPIHVAALARTVRSVGRRSGRRARSWPAVRLGRTLADRTAC